MVDSYTVGLLKATIHRLNPGARIITSEFGRVKSEEILNTGLFDFEEAQNSAGWQKELESEGHTPETEEYGIGSFVFRSQKPFHPERFWNYLNIDYPQNIIRAKGLFWLASRRNDALNFLRPEVLPVWKKQVYGGVVCHMQTEYDIPLLYIIRM